MRTSDTAVQVSMPIMKLHGAESIRQKLKTLTLSKNANNKKCAPKLIFFNEKKIEKDSDNF